jgi:ATP-binding cassette, sub-family E, member 1
MIRVAVLDKSRCKPNDCNHECMTFCPPQRNNVEVIKIDPAINKAVISEELCIGCTICVKKCPYGAISIVNLPDELESDCSHRFGVNDFRLYRLPIPRPGQVLGLLGANGTGKSTALQVLSGRVKPNLGKWFEPPEWEEIIRYYRGSELQPYFEKLSKSNLKTVLKPQNVEQVARSAKGTVSQILQRVNERDALEEMKTRLQLETVWDRNIEVLSGGELQRVAIAAACLRKADVYLFDEPSSYLDVKQRVSAVRTIRSLLNPETHVVVVEHDLALLDYLSDNVCLFYGKPSVYGIVTQPFGTRVGINIYLDGYLQQENVRFRDEAVRFHLRPVPVEWRPEDRLLAWPKLSKKLENFSLTADPGEIHIGESIGILGPNGIGKTTFVKLLAGVITPDEGYIPQTHIRISYKPQYITPDYDGNVQSLLSSVAGGEYGTSIYESTILNPLQLTEILDREVKTLSGGELQRTAIAISLSRKAELYLLDEPSAFLDVEQRLRMARTVKRIVESRGAAAFVVEHDVVTLDFIANSLITFHGTPSLEGNAAAPSGLRKGMNNFLKEMGVTFRRDLHSGRPRVNKDNSWMDRHQKELNEYYYVPTAEQKE